MDLESRHAALQSDLENMTPASLSRRTQDPTSWLPRAPPTHSLESHQDTINCIAFHPTFSSIASGSDDFTIKIWDWELGELEKTIKGHTRAVLDLDYGGPSSGVLLASCSSDYTIRLWDPADEYKNIRTLVGHDHSVSAVRFLSPSVHSSSSDHLLVSASRDRTVRIWNVTTGYCVKTLQGHSEWVRAVSPSDDGRFVLSAGDDMTARLWDVSASNPESKAVLLGHEHYIECCALAPPTSYTHLAPLTGPKESASSSTSQFMATGSRDKTIRLWDAQGTCLMTLVGHDNWVRAIAFHPGGKYLLSVSDDKTLRCWDLSQGGKCVKTLEETHQRFITCLKWIPMVVKSAPATSDETSGSLRSQDDRPTQQANGQIRCVVATGSVDRKLRIFAN